MMLARYGPEGYAARRPGPLRYNARSLAWGRLAMDEGVGPIVGLGGHGVSRHDAPQSIMGGGFGGS